MYAFFIAFFILIAAFWLYSWAFQRWYEHETRDARYFKKALNHRLAFIAQLKNHGRVLVPFYTFMAKGINPKTLAATDYQHRKFPAHSCNAVSLNAAISYQASNDDIFVVTFMKSGTSWLQNMVFQILERGDGEFNLPHPHLYATSPWLESSGIGSISMEEAPKIGLTQKRIIKTHLDATLCPYSASAKYLYLERDPVSTFISCAQFFQKMTGPFCPTLQELADLFCSTQMFWGSWPEHTQQWKNKATKDKNVLYLYYHEINAAPELSIQAISDFLNIPLSAEEIKKIAQKTHIKTMKHQEAYFEMAAPNIFSVTSNVQFLNNNTADFALPTNIEEQIKRFCQATL